MRKHVFFVSLIFFANTFLQAQTWNAPMNVVEPYSGTGGIFGEWPRLLVVNGNPAMAAYDRTRGNLLFTRANDASGTVWGPLVPVDIIGNVGIWNSMTIVNGNPALAYYDLTNLDLKYVRANDPDGSSWGLPLTLDATGSVGQFTSLQVVNGNPAVAYYDATNQDLKFIRAADGNGSSWNPPTTIEATGNVGQWTSLQIVNGQPAISYFVDNPNNHNLKFIRANDASGTNWGSSVTLDFSMFSTRGQYNSLQIVNGNPAISYYDANAGLKYIRANDAFGTAWGTAITLPTGSSAFGLFTSLQIVDGNPAISYYNNTTFSLWYARASDANGTNWPSTKVITSSYYGYYTSMQMVNGYPAVAHMGYGTELKYNRASDMDGSAWSSVSLTFDVTGDIGQWSSMQIVNGNPAISFFEQSSSSYGLLRYLRANDANGVSWGTPVTPDVTFGDVGKYSSLQMVNGNPAIAYLSNGDLKYVRATNSSGTAWGTPVYLDFYGLTPEAFNSLQIVNGNPAISYYSGSGSLKYVRATDASGTVWSSPVTLDATGLVGLYSSLLIVNGNPAICYFDYLNTKLKYIRATDVNGTSWSAPITVDDPPGSAGFYTSMAIVNGNPAISYSNGSALELKYVRATDANGSLWGTPLTIDVTAFVGYHTSLQVVNGKPAISYYDQTNRDLKYIIATDASGTTWTAPVTLDATGDVGSYNSMQMINGGPAVSYYDASNGLLKFISASSTASISTSLNITSTCIGSGFTVDYSSTNATFNAGNIFTAQLSDAAGSFSNPVNIGTFSSTSVSGTINVIVPSNTPPGDNYLIRVVSSDPVITGSASGSLIISSTNSWTGAVNTAWEDPANWSCGSVPGGYTDAVINSGTVILNSNGTCRTLTVMPGANFTVNPGFTLTVMH